MATLLQSAELFELSDFILNANKMAQEFLEETCKESKDKVAEKVQALQKKLDEHLKQAKHEQLLNCLEKLHPGTLLFLGRSVFKSDKDLCYKYLISALKNNAAHYESGPLQNPQIAGYMRKNILNILEKFRDKPGIVLLDPKTGQAFVQDSVGIKKIGSSGTDTKSEGDHSYKPEGKITEPLGDGLIRENSIFKMQSKQSYIEIESIEKLHEAALKGDRDAQFTLGSGFQFGNGVEKNDKEAALWYQRAAEQGHAEAQSNLGIMLLFGTGVKKDERAAVQWFMKAAEQGMMAAQFNLATALELGKGITKDEAAAVQWYRKAAEQGEPRAQCNLALALGLGKGIAQDERAATQWFKKAAVQGEPRAQYYYGMAFILGKGGLPVDDSEAVKWFKKSAEQGNTDAQVHYAMAFMYGKGGLATDHKQAIYWFRKAAPQEGDDAQCMLGTLLMGDSNEANRKEGFELLKKSAEQGNEKALAIFQSMAEVTSKSAKTSMRKP